MWTWSISATGKRDDVLKLIAAQECQLDGDGNKQDADALGQFKAAQDKVVKVLSQMKPEDYCEVGISGNTEFFSDTILFRQTSGPLAGQMVQAEAK